jgi:hypothetical protein
VSEGLVEMAAIVGVFGGGAYTVTTLARLFVQWRMQARGGGIDRVALEERLARLEASVEGLSADTQRLLEGHRFFTDLLSKRPAPPAIASPPSAHEAGRNGPAS